MTLPVVLLAGGLGRRLGGGDKPLREVGGRSLLHHVRDRMAPQASALLLNANGDPARFAGLGLRVEADPVGGFPGPLAGILAGMRWAARHHPAAGYLVSVPTDTPFLPEDLVARLAAARAAEGADIAIAASDGRIHPIAALWPVALAAALERALVQEKLRQVTRWIARYRVAVASFAFAGSDGGEAVDPFFNINSPEDLAAAERLMRQSDGPQGAERSCVEEECQFPA